MNEAVDDIAAGRAAWERLRGDRKSWTDWLAVGRAIQGPRNNDSSHSLAPGLSQCECRAKDRPRAVCVSCTEVGIRLSAAQSYCDKP
jgi:hypothetical protein